MNCSTDEICVFLGPSMPLYEAQVILKARYFPPAQQGDILSIVTQFRPKIIALIDGFFMQTLSVWHKEILYALHQGILVLGASSMGALRAAETVDFGMIGVGKIFEHYKTGLLTDDDEVALIHGPAEEGYFPLSLPLVNIRFTLEYCQKAGKLEEKLCQQILLSAQSLHYPDRTLEEIAKTANKRGIDTESVAQAIDCLKHHYVDQKKEDARFLLEQIQKDVFRDKQPPKNTFFTSSVFEMLYHYDRRHIEDGINISQKEIAQYIALHHPHFPELQFQALNQLLTTLLATILKIEVKEEEIKKEKQRFCLQNRLLFLEEKKWHEWLTTNHLSEQEFHDLMHARAQTRALQKSLCTGDIPWKQTKVLLNELKLRNQYSTWLQKALQEKQQIQDRCPYYFDIHQEDLDKEDIVEDHLRKSTWNPDLPYQEWALEAGFHDVMELKMAILKAKILRDCKNDAS